MKHDDLCEAVARRAVLRSLNPRANVAELALDCQCADRAYKRDPWHDEAPAVVPRESSRMALLRGSVA